MVYVCNVREFAMVFIWGVFGSFEGFRSVIFGSLEWFCSVVSSAAWNGLALLSPSDRSWSVQWYLPQVAIGSVRETLASV